MLFLSQLSFLVSARHSYINLFVFYFFTVRLKLTRFNQVCSNKNSKLFTGINPLSDFYFVHSYRMESNAEINQSFCHYDGNFISSYEVGNIAGVQFHPELSQTNGLKLLNNFITYF